MATEHCPSLAGKQVGVHTLGRTCATNLLEAGVDLTIALLLGHGDLCAVQIHLDADLAWEERASARTALHDVAPGRYRPPDQLPTFLEPL